MVESEKKRQLTNMVASILVATLALLTVILGIKIKPSVSQQASSRPDSMIFSLPEDPSQCTPAQAQLVKWLEYKDPTHVSLPPEESSHRDFPSRNWANRDSEFFAEKKKLPPADTTLIKQDPYVFEPRPPVAPTQDIRTELERSSLARVQYPNPPQPVPAPDAGVYWVDEHSRTIGDIPVLPLAALEPDGLVVTGSTYLTISPAQQSRLQPRITLRKSCGARPLDTIAMKHLARWLRRLTVKKSNPLRDAWLMTPRKVAVVWKYVPGITYSLPKENVESDPIDEPNAG